MTNNPEVVAYHHINKEDPEHRGVSLHHDPNCTSTLTNTEPLIRLSDYEALQAEFEQLRKDAEFGRSVLSKREPGKVYGCHCDLDEGMEPDGCVIDSGERHNCIYAKDISVKEQCSYWRVIASDADPKPAELPRSLPDSLPMEPYQTVDRGSPHYKAGWNACRRAMLAALSAEQQLDVVRLVEALSALRGCIMETRGPDAHSALVLADEALAAYHKGKENHNG